MTHPRVFSLVAAMAAAFLAGCAGKPVEVVESRQAMDTEVTVRVIAPNETIARAALAAAWNEMDLCARLLNRYRTPSEAWIKGDKDARRDPEQQPSDVWRVNHDAGRWTTEVNPLVTSCLAAAKEAFTVSGGAFDPTVGPLVDLWRRAAERHQLPTEEEVAKDRALVGMDKIEVLVATVQKPATEIGFPAPDAPPPKPEDFSRVINAVGLRAGMQLDLGGIAKGYIAGRMAVRMKQTGALAGLVAAAGDDYAFGERPASLAREGGDRRWGVAVQDPRFPDDHARWYTAVHVGDASVNTSGHYYRGYTIEGKRYSHILDPRTGWPVDTHIASVTVVADDPALGDALATAIAVMGVKAGMEMVEKTDDVECLILEAVLKEGQTFQSNGAPPPDAELVAHRSKGFSALEFKPGGK